VSADLYRRLDKIEKDMEAMGRLVERLVKSVQRLQRISRENLRDIYVHPDTPLPNILRELGIGHEPGHKPRKKKGVKRG